METIHSHTEKKKLGKGLSNGFGWAPRESLWSLCVHNVMCVMRSGRGAQRNPEEDTFKQPCKDIKIGLTKTLYMQAAKCVWQRSNQQNRENMIAQSGCFEARERVSRSLQV